MSLKAPKFINAITDDDGDDNLEPVSDKELEDIVKEISDSIIKDIKTMPPTQEEIEYNAAKTPKEQRAVFNKYNN